MASSINSTSAGNGGLVSTGDDSGILNIQTNETTAITVDASQRVAFVAGTAALPAITTTGDTNTGIFFPAADTIAFSEGGAESMRIDSSGNVGIGTTSPSTYGQFAVYTAASNTEAAVVSGGANYATYRLQNSSIRYSMQIRTDQSNAWTLRDETAGANRLLIRASDGLLFSPPMYANTSGNSANVVVNPDGGVLRSTSALKYKQDIRDLPSIDITKFRPIVYKSKCEGDDQTKDHFGFIADEVDAAGIKELVQYGAKGEIEGFSYDRLSAVLVKAIQELKAINDTQAETINALTARIVALEGQ